MSSGRSSNDEAMPLDSEPIDANNAGAAPEPAVVARPAAVVETAEEEKESALEPEPEPLPALPAFHHHLLGRLMTAKAAGATAIASAKDDIRKGEQLMLEGERLVRQGRQAKLEAEHGQEVADRMFGTKTGWIVKCGDGVPPRFVRPDLRDANIRQLARGAESTVALSTSGKLQAALDGDMEAVFPWIAPDDGTGVVQVAAGNGFGLGLSARGQVYVWSNEDPNSPVRVPAFQDDGAVQLFAGPASDAWMALTKNGNVCKFGTSAGTVSVGTGPDFRTTGMVPFELVGIGQVYVQTLIPRAMPSGPSRTVLSVSVGMDFVVVAARNAAGEGVVHSAGCNLHGQLGRATDGQRHDELTEVRLNILADGSTARHLLRSSCAWFFVVFSLSTRSMASTASASAKWRRETPMCSHCRSTRVASMRGAAQIAARRATRRRR
jgi:hypothetical protein